MLRELRIQNFKGWRDTGLIRMAPITLFFGANSSGKSSIGQFLMMLKQTVESPDRKAVLYPGGRNTAVQLGSFQEMVFHRNMENKISYYYMWELPEKLEINNFATQQALSGEKLSFSATVGLDTKDRRTLVLDCMKYQLLDDTSQKIISVGMKRQSEFKYSFEGEEDESQFIKNRFYTVYPEDFGAPVHFYGFPDEIIARFQNVEYLKDLNFRLEKNVSVSFLLGTDPHESRKIICVDRCRTGGCGIFRR